MRDEVAWAPWPVFSEEEIAAAVGVLRSGRVNYWTGEQGRCFEEEFAAAVGAQHAVWLANGTVALELAIRALELPAGSQVITTPRTFVATSAAIVNNGLRPVFADVDAESGNLTPQGVEQVRTNRTSAIVVVHLAGWPADVEGMRELADRHGLRVVEDCAQAHGAAIDGRSVGSFGDIAAWSFCQDKIMSTGGEGGMVTTSRESLRRRVWQLKDHGKSWAAVHEREHPPGFRWLHDDFGTNGRGTEMQAAIGRVQLGRLRDWTRQRTANAMRLRDRLAAAPAVRVPVPGPGLTHAYYRLNAYLDTAALAPGWTRDRVIAEAGRRHAIPLSTGSCSEIYLERAFQRHGLRPDRLAVARAMSSSSLAFLVHPGLTTEQLDLVGDGVGRILEEATSRGR